MTDTTNIGAKTPWHLWAVGLLSLLWNGFGAYDFIMSLTQGDAYFQQMGMTAAQMAYINAMPDWTLVPWAMGVWGALAGSVLLLLRMRLALHAFVVSLAGLFGSLVYAFGLSNGAEVMKDHMTIQFVILAICLFLVWYAWAMTKKGVLR